MEAIRCGILFALNRGIASRKEQKTVSYYYAIHRCGWIAAQHTTTYFYLLIYKMNKTRLHLTEKRLR